MIPARTLYWNISLPWLMYPLLALAAVIFMYGFCLRLRVWKKGQPLKKQEPDKSCLKASASRTSVLRRIKYLLVDGLGQRKVWKDDYQGLLHPVIFWGFIFLFLGTLAVALQAHLGLPLLQGNFYLILSLLLDVFGLLAVAGVLLALGRRTIFKPACLNTPDDFVILFFLLIILISGFVLESLRIAATRDPWAAWSPVGQAGAAFFAAWGMEEMIRVYQAFWWGHLVLAFLFIAYLPYSKLLHLFTAPVSLFLRNTSDARGVWPYLDLERESDSYGIGAIGDYTWKQLMDTGSCTRCGRCLEHCPAYLAGKPLSPKKNLQDLKAGLEIQFGAQLPSLLQRKYLALQGIYSSPAPSENQEGLWLCTTCGACASHCPVSVEHIGMTAGRRRYQVLTKDEYPAPLQAVYRNLDINGNPWGIGHAERAGWLKDTGAQVLPVGEEVEYLFWVGCMGAYDLRSRKITATVSRLFGMAQVSFAVLGAEEKCCGDTARRTGHEYLFQTLARENIQTLQKYRFKKIVTFCPHCYHTLAFEYPQLGADYEVIHHSRLLRELLQAGKLKLAGAKFNLTYHDPCYLGRYHGMFREPRNVLQSVTGVNIIEMKRSRENGFCCGGGGGRMWLEEAGSRINEIRTEEALAGGVDLVATSCPFCLTMLEDGLKAKKETGVFIQDISEILLQGLNKMGGDQR